MTDISEMPNTVTMLNQARDDRTAQQAQANLRLAASSNPADVAINLRVADVTGLTHDYVGRNREMIEQQAMLERVKNNPVLANWHAQDPANAAISLDKIPFLQTAAEKLGNVGKSVLSGVGPAFSEGVYGALEATTGTVDQAMTAAGLPPSYWGNISRFFGGLREGSGRVREQIKSSMQNPGFVENSIYSGFESLGQTASGIAASVITRNPLYALGMAGVTTAGQSAGQAMDKGLSPARALVYGAEDGAVEVLTEKIPFFSLLKDLKVGSSFGKMIMRQIALEVPGELAATTLQDFNEYANLTPDAPFSDYVKRLPEDLAGTLIATLSSVGVQTGIAKAAQGIADRASGLDRQRVAAEAAMASVQGMHDLMQSPDGQEMLSRSPDRVRGFLNSADDNQTFHIAAKPMMELFQSLPEEARVTLLKSLPGFDGQLQEAAAAETDIIMRRGDYAALFASQPWSAPLVKHVRENPTDFSQAEIEELTANPDILAEMMTAQDGEPAGNRIQRKLQDAIQNAAVPPAQAGPVSELMATGINRMAGLQALAGRTGEIADKMVRALTFRRQAAEYVQPERITQTVQNLRNIQATLAPDAKAGATTSGEGKSLLSFLAERGGVDVQNESASGWVDDAKTWHQKKKGTPRLVGGKKAVPLDEAARAAAEAGYIKERDTVALQDAIQQELSGNKVFSEQMTASLRDSTKAARTAEEEQFYDFMTRGLNLDDAEIRALTPEKLQSLIAEYEAGNGQGDGGQTLNQFDSDAGGTTPYTDPAITVDGKERPTTNSKGQPIAATKEGLENFWRWFGDSKVVDADGKPLVVYHGTKDWSFEAFSKDRIGSATDSGWLGYGFYFSDNYGVALGYSSIVTDGGSIKRGSVIEAYLSIENPAEVSGALEVNKLKAHGIRGDFPHISNDNDGVIATTTVYGKTDKELVAFSPAQIKSIHNRGTFAKDDARILYQGGQEETLDELRSRIMSSPEYGGPEMLGLVETSKGVVILNSIDFVKRKQGQGFGTKIMQEITNWADRNGKRIELSPSVDFGASSMSRLKKFYKKFGFVENRGKNRDFSTQESMYRLPEVKSLQQQNRGSIYWSDTMLQNVIISLTSGANLSTLLHEAGHYFSLLHRQTAEMARATLAAGTVTDPEVIAQLEQVTDDWDKLKSALDVKGDTLTEEQEEQIATWFEQYLREGKAPKVELRGVFATFKSWLLSIYTAAKMHLLGKSLNNEVRTVFDRWLATDAEIREASSVNLQIEQIAEQFDALNAKAETKDERKSEVALAAKVARLLTRAGNKAGDELMEEVVKQENKKQTQEWKDDYAKTLDEVTKAADESKVYAVQDHIRDGHKLDAKLVEAMVGKEVAKRLPNGLRGGTANPDLVAGLFGFVDGADMLRAIASNLPKKAFIEQETKRLMDARYGNMLEDGRAAQRARVLVANDEVGDAINLLVRTSGEKKQTRSLVKAAARQRMLDTRFADLHPHKYEMARDKALRSAYEAGAKGDGGRAAQHIWKAMLNHELLMAANEMQEAKAKKLLEWKKLTGKPRVKTDEKLAKLYDLDLLDVARAMLGRSGLGVGIQGYDVQAKLTEHGGDDLDTLVLAQAEAGRPQKGHRDMTGAEFKAFSEAIDNIRKVARDRRQMILDGERVPIQTLVEAGVAEFKSLADGKTAMNTREAQQDRLLKAKGWLLNTNTWLMRVEHWARSIEGDNLNGPLQRIFRSIKTACNDYHDALNVTTKDMVAILKPLDGTLDGHSIAADELGMGQKIMGRRELLGLMLHLGNESNTDKLVGGYKTEGWTHDGLWKFVQRMIETGKLTRTDMEAVQKVWDLLDSLKPQAQAAHYQRYGYRFDEVTATPFTLNFDGEEVTFRGGYFPAITNPALVTDAATRERLESALESSQAVMWPKTQQGQFKSRVETYQAPLQLDAALAMSHVSKVLKFIHLENPVRQAARVFKDRRLQEVIGRTNPHVVSKTIMPWLQRVARQGVNSTRDSTGIARFANAQRSYAGVSAMALNTVNTLQQYFDLATVAQEVGAANLSRATSRFMASPRASVKLVAELSGEMRNRLIVFQEEMPSAVMQILRDVSKAVRVRDAAIHHGYILQRMAQMQIDTVTFMAAYDKALADGMSEADAVYFAERTIRLTQSSSRPEDVSNIEAYDNPWARLFIMFYGWFNNKYNQQVYGISRILRENGWKEASPKIAYLMLMTTIVPYVLGQAVYDGFTGGLPDDDDDDGVVDDWLFWFMSATFRGMGAEIPGVREVTSGIVGVWQGKTYEKGLMSSPVVTNVDKSIRFLFGDLRQNLSGNEVDMSKEFQDFMALITVTTGVPTGQLGRTGGYLLDIYEGDVRPQGIGDVVAGLLAGSPRK